MLEQLLGKDRIQWIYMRLDKVGFSETWSAATKLYSVICHKAANFTTTLISTVSLKELKLLNDYRQLWKAYFCLIFLLWIYSKFLYHIKLRFFIFFLVPKHYTKQF